MGRFIPLSVPNLHGNEQKYADDAIAAEWVSTGGAYITRMERMIADYLQMPAAAACHSGTAALHLAMIACGVRPGDEVIVPTLTFIAAVNPVRYVGAEPVFMDCDDTLCMDMDKLEQFLKEECVFQQGELHNKTTGRRIAAVVVVHVFGNLANMQQLMRLRGQYGFSVIEDATEALGTRALGGPYQGRFAGTIGDIGAFSFNGNKIITTGGGGMLVSNHPDKLERMRYLSTQAKDDPLYFIHGAVGYNYRMTNLQAAVGVAQLEQLEAFIEIKARNFAAYQQNGIPLLPFREDTRPNRWFYSFLSSNRDGLIRFLSEKEIQSRPVWALIHTLAPYAGCMAYRIEKAPGYCARIVNLPCSTNLSAEDAAYVAKMVRAFEEA